MHFFVPFWFLMSRNIKRRLPLLGDRRRLHGRHARRRGVLDRDAELRAARLRASLDLGCLLGVVGIYLAAVLRGMEEYSLVAVGDPRLARALEFENA